MNFFMIITKNHAAGREIGFLTKSISKPDGCATTMPTAWELRLYIIAHEFGSRKHGCRYVTSSRKNLTPSEQEKSLSQF